MEWNETSAKLDAVSIMIVATRVRRILCARGTAFLGLSVSFRCCGLLDLWDLRLIFSCCIVDATCSFDPSVPLGRDGEEGLMISFYFVTGSNCHLRVSLSCDVSFVKNPNRRLLEPAVPWHLDAYADVMSRLCPAFCLPATYSTRLKS
jgi:hypothetical protein